MNCASVTACLRKGSKSLKKSFARTLLGKHTACSLATTLSYVTALASDDAMIVGCWRVEWGTGVYFDFQGGVFQTLLARISSWRVGFNRDWGS